MRVTAVQLATASAHAATLNEAAARLICLEKLGLIMTAVAVILNRKHPSFSLGYYTSQRIVIVRVKRATVCCFLAMHWAVVCTKNSHSNVLVMKSTEERTRHNAACPLDRAREGRIFVQRSVCSHFIVISGIGF